MYSPGAELLGRTVKDIREGYDHLDAPHRNAPEARVMKAVPGPTAPVSSSVVDVRIDTERTLRAICTEYAGLLDLDPPNGYDVGTLCRWLACHVYALAGALHPGDALDLEIIRDRLVRLSGLHDDDATAATALAETRRRVLPGASHYGTSREVARLATAAGRPVSHNTVVRWAAQGAVAVLDGRYSLNDTLEYHDERRAEAAEHRGAEA